MVDVELACWARAIQHCLCWTRKKPGDWTIQKNLKWNQNLQAKKNNRTNMFQRERWRYENGCSWWTQHLCLPHHSISNMRGEKEIQQILYNNKETASEGNALNQQINSVNKNDFAQPCLPNQKLSQQLKLLISLIGIVEGSRLKDEWNSVARHAVRTFFSLTLWWCWKLRKQVKIPFSFQTLRCRQFLLSFLMSC